MTNQQNNRILSGLLVPSDGVISYGDREPLNDPICMHSRFMPMLRRRRDRRAFAGGLVRSCLPFSRIVRLLRAR